LGKVSRSQQNLNKVSRFSSNL